MEGLDVVREGHRPGEHGVADIVHLVGIQAEPRRVYRALTESRGLAAWWTCDATAMPEVGSVAVFGFNRREVVFRMFVLELKPDELVRWRCLGGHPEWKGTEVTFALARAPRATTLLRFSHRGWRSTGGIYARCRDDWARSLASLKRYVETGHGSPYPG